jgi:hypothetical protein
MQRVLFFWGLMFLFFSSPVLSEGRISNCSYEDLLIGLNTIDVLEAISSVDLTSKPQIYFDDLNKILSEQKLKTIFLKEECNESTFNAVLVVLSKDEPVGHAKIIIESLKMSLIHIGAVDVIDEEARLYHRVTFVYFNPAYDSVIIKKYVVREYDVLEIKTISKAEYLN